MKFKIAREKSGMSQRELAQALGVDQSAVCLWETGKTKPRANLLPTIAKILCCSIDDLLADDAAQTKEDAAAYRAWQQELAQKGVEPEVLLARYEAAGMTDYVKQVRAVIRRTEGSV